MIPTDTQSIMLWTAGIEAVILFGYGVRLLYKAYRRRRLEAPFSELEADAYIMHNNFPAPLPPRSISDATIRLDSTCTSEERMRFVRLIEDLDHGDISIKEFEDAIASYVHTCRVERRLLDRELLTILGRELTAARFKVRDNFTVSIEMMKASLAAIHAQENEKKPIPRHVLILED